MFAAIIIGIFIISVIYAHSRGKEKQTLSRQLFDHSTFMAPINMFMTAFSSLPAREAFFETERFPELKTLTENWQVIREEAVRLQDHIKAAQNNNDAGFNTFFKRGWKRFYLKWYADAHPSAQALCPVTTQLVSQIPCVKAAQSWASIAIPTRARFAIIWAYLPRMTIAALLKWTSSAIAGAMARPSFLMRLTFTGQKIKPIKRALFFSVISSVR